MAGVPLTAGKSAVLTNGKSAPDAELRIKACDGLTTVFGDMAAAEALTRALIAERTEKRDQAHMWLDVYYLICSHTDEQVPVEILRL